MDPACSRRRVLAATGLLASTGVATGLGAGRSAVDAADRATDPPPLRWTERYDDSADDSAMTATLTDAGLVVFAGETAAEAGDGDRAPWLVAIDSHGQVEWQTTLDLRDDPLVRDLAPAPDGGVVAGAERRPADGASEALLVRLDEDGAVQWETPIDGPLDQSVAFSVVRVDDEFLVGGATRADRTSALLARVDDEGAVQWVDDVAVGSFSLLFSLIEAADGTYVGCGVSRGVTGSTGLLEAWLIAVDGEGTRQWTTSHLPSSGRQAHTGTFARDVVPTDDGFLAVGSTTPPSASARLPFVLATDDVGEQTAERTFDPQGLDSGNLSAVLPVDGIYMAAGATTRDGAASGHWFQGFDASGAEQWARRQVIGDDSRAGALTPTADGGVFAVGSASTETDDGTDSDAVVVKLGGDPRPTSTPTATATPSPPTPTPNDPSTRAPMTEPASNGTETTGSETTGADGPGVGVTGALAALGAGALLHRSRDDDAA